MALMNTLDNFLKQHGVETAYRFQKDTGLAEATARRLFKRRDVYPDAASTMKICKAYSAQPGDFLIYVPDSDEVA